MWVSTAANLEEKQAFMEVKKDETESYRFVALDSGSTTSETVN
jgi:hypothetical protein